jgi:hypothetical protein
MNKFYKIRIVGKWRQNKQMWYADKVGFDYIAKLGIKQNKAVFILNTNSYVHPEDCAVVCEYIDIMSKFCETDFNT